MNMETRHANEGVKADMAVCGQSLPRVEEKAPPVSRRDFRGSGLNLFRHGHEPIPLSRSYPIICTYTIDHYECKGCTDRQWTYTCVRWLGPGQVDAWGASHS
ncbi:hypothetical protein E2C01_010255 [Portunus trituberculatus]|uniref:Uncharacterized protein n=1 Tax=Portunus trituberculatus TaxID=210409 RepID=A0A5B7D7W0_PORTR|nr:hypothetical protein [Portunus trituberculatus]